MDVRVPGWLAEHLPMVVWTADARRNAAADPGPPRLSLRSFAGPAIPDPPAPGAPVEEAFADAHDPHELIAAHHAALRDGAASFAVDWRGRTWAGWVRRRGPARLVTVAIDVSERLPGGDARPPVEAMGRLAGGIAHDFNNILTVVIGSARYAAESIPADSPVQEDLQAIHEAAQRAARLTRQLLAFSRQQLVRPERVALDEVVRRAEPRLRRAAGPGIHLALERDGDPCWVRIDVAAFEQVLVELVRNARDAIAGEGRIRVCTGPDPGGDGWAVLEVSDDGAGMPPEVVARAFEPFFTTRPVGRGTGLGLATCHGIVHQAGGTIALRSSPGAGTRVVVTLPRDRSAERTPDRAVATASDGSGKRVLVVEDEAFVRRVVLRALSRANYRVDVAADPVEALDRFGARGYDLLLTDVMMPGITGDELARRMTAENPNLRVLLMTGFAGRIDLGTEVLQKPFSVDVLLQRVREALAR